MRQIGTLANQQLARRFTDFLTTLGISAVAEQEQESWSIWIRDEDQVERSRSALRDFSANPNSETFAQATVAAQKVREETAKREREAAKQRVNMRDVWAQPLFKRAPLMATLVAITTAVFFLTGNDFSKPSDTSSALGFFDPIHLSQRAWQAAPDPYVDIRTGQIWRLFTPVFLHGGFIHFFFNMYMFYHLAGAIELRHGKWRLAMVVLASGILGNVGQFQFSDPVPLGGMSGVDYGLLGFLWIRGMLFPKDRLAIRRETVVVMLAYLLLGFTGVMDRAVAPVANYAHLFGLIGGMGVAYSGTWASTASPKN